MRIIPLSRKLHKWLMLFVGLQTLLWAISGCYMVSFDIDYIHGDSLVHGTRPLIAPSQVQLSLAELRRRYPDAEQITLVMQQHRPVYRFKQGKQTRLLDAKSGQLLDALTQAQAQDIARQAYTGTGAIVRSELLGERAPDEVSPRILPAWRIEFADIAAPTLYISAETGEVVGKRHDFWRGYDWLFRLHIMDYGSDEDAGNWLLRIVALLTLLATVTGAVLTYVAFVRVRGNLIRTPRRQRIGFKLMPWVRFLHRWLSLLLVLQLLLWLGTGLYFNLMDHRKASGNQHRVRFTEATTAFDSEKLYSLTALLQRQAHVVRAELVNRLEHPYYLLGFAPDGSGPQALRQQLYDGYSGAPVPLLESMARALAGQSYSGTADIAAASLLAAPSSDFPAMQNRLWRVNFNDAQHTAVYLDAQSGRIAGHSDDDKRVADWMYRLHFMDYLNRGNFNNAQVIFFALLMLWLSLTGVYWLLHLIKHRQFI